MNQNREVSIEVRSRHGSVSEFLRNLVTEKCQRLVKFHDRTSRIHVVADQENADFRLEIVVHADSGATIVAKATDSSAKRALDLCLDKVERQLKKHNERLKQHKGERADLSVQPPEPVGQTEETYDQIVRRGLGS